MKWIPISTLLRYSSAPSDREPLDNGLGCSDHYRYSAKTTAIIDIETPSQESTLGQRADSRARRADTTSLVSTRQDRSSSSGLHEAPTRSSGTSSVTVTDTSADGHQRGSLELGSNCSLDFDGSMRSEPQPIGGTNHRDREQLEPQLRRE